MTSPTTSSTRTPMTGVPDWPYGPYTIDDLDALPDEGVRRELVNGWILVAPGRAPFTTMPRRFSSGHWTMRLRRRQPTSISRVPLI